MMNQVLPAWQPLMTQSLPWDTNRGAMLPFVYLKVLASLIILKEGLKPTFNLVSSAM